MRLGAGSLLHQLADVQDCAVALLQYVQRGQRGELTSRLRAHAPCLTVLRFRAPAHKLAWCALPYPAMPCRRSKEEEEALLDAVRHLGVGKWARVSPGGAPAGR